MRFRWIPIWPGLSLMYACADLKYPGTGEAASFLIRCSSTSVPPASSHIHGSSIGTPGSRWLHTFP